MTFERNASVSNNVLYLLQATTFLVYIPISYFRNDMFLVALDVLLLLGLCLTVTNRRGINRILIDFMPIFFLIVVYVINLLAMLSLEIAEISFDSIKIVRNFLFGIGVFTVSSVWMTTQQRVDKFVKILLWCVVLASIYGYRQLLFGYMPFELDRLAMMGSSISEMEIMGRARMTSSFGDPLLFGFYMMVGIFILMFARYRNIACVFIHKLYAVSVLLIISALVLSLTRAPLVGMICGFILLVIFNAKKIVYNIPNYAIYVVLICAVVLILNIIPYSIWSDDMSGISQNFKHGIDSLSSLYLMVSGMGDSDSYFLVNQSKDARLLAWMSGLDFLFNNPFGGGLSDTSHYMFSTTDVGLLSIGLRTGIFGMVVVLLLLFLIGIYSITYISCIPDTMARSEGYILFSLWVSIIITLGISDLFSSSAASVVIWIIAGILVNQRRIYSSRSLTNCMAK